MADTTSVPAAAVALLHHFEGCEKKRPDGRIGPYRDAVGIPTIGWGNTRWQSGAAVKMADTPITQEQADALFLYWLADFDRKVRVFLPGGVSEGPHAAFLSFAYNVGVAAAENSTAATRLAAGDLKGAAEALTWWNKAGGRVLKGLQRRREAEKWVLLGAAPDTAIQQGMKAFP